MIVATPSDDTKADSDMLRRYLGEAKIARSVATRRHREEARFCRGLILCH